MTDMPVNQPSAELQPELSPGLRPEIRNWCEVWRTCLQNVLGQVSGQPATFEISTAPVPTSDSDVLFSVVAGGAVRGEMTLRLPAASGTRLAQKLLSETGAAGE